MDFQSTISVLTVVIAGSVATIAYMQWRTNNQKVLLELFDRRYEVMLGTLRAIQPIMQNGHPDDEMTELRAFDQATAVAPFIYGEDVVTYLGSLRKRIIHLSYCRSMLRDLPVGDERSNLVNQQQDDFLEICNIYEKLPLICNSYLKLHNKHVRTLTEWFKDRDKVRQAAGEH